MKVLVKMIKGSEGKGRSMVVLKGEGYRWLFNVQQGFSRYQSHFSTSTHGVQSVFFTSSSVYCLIGLPSLLLTHPKNKTNIYSPPQLKSFLQYIARYFTNDLSKVNPVGQWFYGNKLKGRCITIKVNKEQVYVYAIQTDKYRGKVSPSFIQQHNLPKQLITQLLQTGSLIHNNKKIYADDIKQKDEDGSGLLIVDLPRQEFIQPLIQNEVIRKYVKGQVEGVVLKGVCHLSDGMILQNESYKHFFQNSTSLYPRISQQQKQKHSPFELLHQQYPMNFPSLYNNIDNLKPQKHHGIYLDCYQDWDLRKGIIQTKQRNLKEWQQKINLEEKIENQKQTYLNNQLNHLQVNCKQFGSNKGDQNRDNFIQSKKDSLVNTNINMHFKNDDLIAFLGTGSCKPSVFRNVSSILLNLSPQFLGILDCGQGSLYQLETHFGVHFKDILLNIRWMFISHYHADHTLGMFNFILRRNQLHPNSPLFIIIPLNLYPLVIQYQRIQPLNTYFLLAHQQYQREEEWSLFRKEAKKYGIELECVQVIHCEQSYGVVIKRQDGKIISYSGDTRPSQQFIKKSQNSDIMIHQATFDDSLIKQALYKKHSTARQAIQSGYKANAKHVVLTHFSQRYKKNESVLRVQNYESQAELYNYSKEHSSIAYDHLCFKIGCPPKNHRIQSLFQ